MAIVHSVFFNLKHPAGSEEENQFFQKSVKILTPIPGVHHFLVMKQTSPKCSYNYGFSMVFHSDKDYQSYNDHPDHGSYVQDIWLNEVAEFQEIDYVAHSAYSPALPYGEAK